MSLLYDPPLFRSILSGMRNRYFDPTLASGANDGTSEANAWQTIAAAVAQADNGDIVWCKATGTATLAGTTAFAAGTSGSPIYWVGYTTKPTWDDVLSTYGTFTIATGTQTVTIGTYVFFVGINFTRTGPPALVPFSSTLIHQNSFLNCKFSTSNDGAIIMTRTEVYFNCSFINTGGGANSAALTSGGAGLFVGCYFEGAGVVIAHISQAIQSVNFPTQLIHCVVNSTSANARDCYRLSWNGTTSSGASMSCLYCTFYGGEDGIELITTLASVASVDLFYGCLFYNLTNGINGSGGDYSRFAKHNASGSIVTTYANLGNFSDAGWDAPQFAVTGDPFTNSGTKDFSLDAAANEGALITNVGFAGNPHDASSSNYLANGFDIGGLQRGRSLVGDGDNANNYARFDKNTQFGQAPMSQSSKRRFVD